MVNNARIGDLIRENRADEIHDAIKDGSFFQMQTFTEALIDLVVAGEVDQEIAANAATNRHDFLVALERALKTDAADKRIAEKEAAEPALPELRLVRPTAS
jgi:Tfp pilus assembly ATPase PilU